MSTSPVTLDFSKSQPVNQSVSLDFSKAKPLEEEKGFLDREIKPDPNEHFGLLGYPSATKSGVQSIGRGVRSAVQGIADTFRAPQDATEVGISAGGPAALPIYRTVKGIAETVRGARQIPGAIHDINQSADPLGTYLKAAQDTAGEGAGQALVALGTEGVARGVTKFGPPIVRGAVRGANTVLEKAPGTIGAASGAAIGHATGIPGASEVGGALGYGVGREVLPRIKIPGEHFGFPERVIGGPEVAPPYKAPLPFRDPGAPLPEHPGTFPGAHLPATPAPELLHPELVSEARTLPGQIGREVIHPKITPAEPIPSRSGLALPPGPQPEAGSMVRSMESPARMSTPSETARAFRSRSVGERGIPFNRQSPAQASLSETEARSIMPGREQVTGEPQELIGLDLDQAPGFSTKPGPRGADWVKFHGEVPEAAIKPISATKPSAITAEQLGQQLNDALGGRPLERGVPIGKQRPLGNLPEKIREAVGPSQQPPRAPLGNLPKQISEHMNPLPEGFTAVDSSAIRGYKYNPAARELEAVTNSGQHYVHGDVSPEEFSKFEAADSKGKAWNDLRKAPGVTQVATVQNGSRVPTRPGVLQTTKGLIAKSKAGMDPDAAVADQDLTAQLKESVRRAKAERKARAR